MEPFGADLRILLANLLIERRNKNPSYSIRALARDLKVNQGQIVRILNGKLRPTPLIAYRVGTHLQLSSDQTIYLISHTVQ